MQRRSLFTAALLAGSLALFGCQEPQDSAAAQASPAPATQTWKMVTAWPKNYPGLGTAAERFAQRVEAMSGGRLKIKVYAAGELVPALEVFDAVSRGTAELGHGAAYYWKGKVPAAQFFTAVPFGLSTLEMNAWVTHGGGLALWQEAYAPYGVRPLLVGNSTMQMGGWFNKEINQLDDLKLAPFHLLASESHVHIDKTHVWHMETLASLCRVDPGLFRSTPYRVVDLGEEASERGAAEWWGELTEHGGEGMVVKPHDFLHEGRRGLVQPALKCRGREYLRIIYGPDYLNDANLSRLRSRGLGRKRSLALREFALGIEGLERFARREPLRRVHECVFGVLALESEPVDPRL